MIVKTSQVLKKRLTCRYRELKGLLMTDPYTIFSNAYCTQIAKSQEQ